jgi:hypothetical protein
MRGTEPNRAKIGNSSGDAAMIKNGGDITKLLINNCHFRNLVDGADAQAHERVCQFIGQRLEQLGYVLVHHSDMTKHSDTAEEKSEEPPPTSSTLTILNISGPKENKS